ncbi:MAG: DNA repair protein RadA [Alphaproteobacteria bacterium]|nr:DNA repair protein RadA [Alphaproteobacteria bacterium]
MARVAKRYVCQNCGETHLKWAGACAACGTFNSVVEETPMEAPPRGLGAGKGAVVPLVPLKGASGPLSRLATGIAEFDRATGGGLVPGSALLVGGDPGIGKSTLLLQVSAALAAKGAAAVYVTGEEATDQVRLRAERLGLAGAKVALAAATSVRDILATIETVEDLKLVVIDSIQTMYLDTIESAPGTVGQVRGAAQELIRHAKRRGAALLLVGHVTKDGQIAGPRVLEHMVDAVLYFEGDRGHQFRILRAVKNRFGPTDEIGVFRMGDRGLAEVADPSALFLGERDAGISGAAVFAGMEGTRPVLLEIQALVAPAPPGSPRRAVVGWDGGRLAMLLAVLDARCGLALGGRDVYLNVAGGLRVAEPAADLAVAAALLSSYTDEAMPERTAVFGEIGLGGEIRPVAQAEARLKEAAKLGFTRALVPAGTRLKVGEIETIELGRLSELTARFDLARARQRERT